MRRKESLRRRALFASGRFRSPCGAVVHPWLLNTAYTGVLAAAAPYFAVQALRTGKYRRGWAAKLRGAVPIRTGDRPCAWFHAVSVGEVNILGTFVPAFRRRHPNWDVAISTTTDSGMGVAAAKFPDLPTFYCPLDFSWAVEAALDRIRPSLLVLAELELWPNLLQAAKARGVAAAVINGRLSENSQRGYRRLGSIAGSLLSNLDLIAVQSETYSRRFQSLCPQGAPIRVTGSIKFDGAETDRGNSKTAALKRLAGIAAGDRVFLAGSTIGEEERIVLGAVQAARSAGADFRTILVPRHPERFDEVAELLKRSPLQGLRRSELDAKESNREWDVLLVDVVGELGAWWGAADVGFVGGSIHPRGGQNMIEPAAYGVATCFGPHTRNFRDIVAQFLEADAAAVVADQTELEAFLIRCLGDDDYARRLGAAARGVVARNLGAVERTLDALDPLVRRAPSAQAA